MNDLCGLKICFLAATLGQGGAERQLFYVLDQLRQKGAVPRLVYFGSNEFWAQRVKGLGIPFVNLGGSRSKMGRLLGLITELRKNRPSLVQSQHFYTSAYVGVAARLLHIPGIGALRSDGFMELKDSGPIGGWLSLRAPTLIVANSQAAIRYAQQRGVRDERLYFLRNAVDTARLKPTARATGHSIRLIAVGSLLQCKRFDRFLSALARLRRDLKMPVTGMIVGAGPLRRQLEQQALALGLIPSAVEFKGSVSEMAPLYSEADICVLTSDHEGTPNVLLEAMACGLPVVATRVGGVSEIIREGENGITVPLGDEASLCDALARLINDPSTRAKMGQMAREYVEANHALRLLPERLLELYRFSLRSQRSAVALPRALDAGVIRSTN